MNRKMRHNTCVNWPLYARSNKPSHEIRHKRGGLGRVVEKCEGGRVYTSDGSDVIFWTSADADVFADVTFPKSADADV